LIVEFAPRHRIETGGRFVQQQQLGPRRQRQRQAQLGARAARHLRRAPVARHVEHAQQAPEFRRIPGRIEAADEGAQLLGCHPGIKIRLLADVADALLERSRHALDGAAQHGDVAAVRTQQAHQQFQGGGLARAVTAEETEHFALPDCEVQAVEGLYLAIAIGDGFERDGVHVVGWKLSGPIIVMEIDFLASTVTLFQALFRD
jgi:hypothetical protein